MKLSSENVVISLPPTLGAVLRVLGPLVKYRIEHNGDSAVVTLSYGATNSSGSKRRNRRRRPKTSQGGPNLAAQPPGVVPPAPKRKIRPTGARQGDPNPVAKPPGAVHSAQPLPVSDRKHSPGAEQGGPKLSAPLTVAIPPDDPPAEMETGHVIVTDPPASPQAPSIAVVADPAAGRESKRRKMSTVSEPGTLDQSEWTIICDNIPSKWQGAIHGDFTDTNQLKGLWNENNWRYLPNGTGKYQLHPTGSGNQIHVTAQQDGLFRQGLLIPDMSNSTIHRILKIVLRDIYPAAIYRNIKVLIEGLPNFKPGQSITSP
ncbi:uncharacterized protein LOC121388205 [Gigantopelta aegis]|uniref:uncharacterized protein LOC121388205 n=1 Tax=Gigantopelta aegis TaxID=1735272 RepID=UPI001B88DDA1|nr:uncharacterized protein LOC121388205 [Gigantopelta aegis]